MAITSSESARRTALKAKWGGNTFMEAKVLRADHIAKRTAFTAKWGGATYAQAKANRLTHISNNTKLVEKWGGANATEARQNRAAHNTSLMARFGGTTLAQARSNRENHISLLNQRAVNRDPTSFISSLLGSLKDLQSPSAVTGLGYIDPSTAGVSDVAGGSGLPSYSVGTWAMVAALGIGAIYFLR